MDASGTVSDVKATYDNQPDANCTLAYTLLDVGTTLQRASDYGTAKAERGNPRCVSRWLDSSSAWVTTGTTYDTAGNVRERFDERNKKTTYDYTDRYTAGTLPPAQTKALVTTITNPLAQRVELSYDYGTGKITQFKDANLKITIYGYADDPLDRLKTVDLPIGRREFVYDDTSRSVTARERVSGPESDPPDPVEKWRERKTTYDGFGRVTLEEQSGLGVVAVKTERRYDALGRVTQISNPYESGSPVWTVSAYDALGRVTTVTRPDGSVDRTCYSAGETVSRDAADRWVKLVEDGLGRLTQAVENPTAACDALSHTGTNAVTNYRYDAADRLRVVCQGGTIDADGTCLAPGLGRTFAYDTLGRLRSATNPESGTPNYTYDAAGNLLTRTDGRGWIACNGSLTGASCDSSGGYDDLNRPLRLSYSAEANTPVVTWTYDTCPNGAGRVCSISNAVAQRSYTYNAMGWVSTSVQTVGAIPPYGFTYAYNEAGGLLRMGYPSGRVVAYEMDGLNRPAKVSSGAAVYADGIGYAPHNAIQSLWLGAKLEQRCYNSRLQLEKLKVGGTALADCAEEAGEMLRLEYGYTAGTNNGNLASQRIKIPGLDLTQSYQYDALNRIARMDEGAEYRVFDYSNTGNMWVASSSASMQPGSFTPRSETWYEASKNRLSNPAIGIGYDMTVGNLTSIGGYSFTYDAENRLKTSTINSATTEYGYDGEGHRVQVGARVFVYDAAGNLAAEYGSTAGGGTQYLVADALGSTRLVLDGFGVVRRRHDYFPFGETMAAGLNGRTTEMGFEATEAPGGIRQRFTGKERDAETGLDYFGARYMSSAQGRFTSPDPLDWISWQAGNENDKQRFQEFIGDPQRLNMYVYARNNPLMYVDPNGEDFEVAVTFKGDISDEEKKRILAAVRNYLTSLDIGKVVVRDAAVASDNTRTWAQAAQDLYSKSFQSVTVDARLTSYKDAVGTIFAGDMVGRGEFADLRAGDPDQWSNIIAWRVLHEKIAHNLKIGSDFDQLGIEDYQKGTLVGGAYGRGHAGIPALHPIDVKRVQDKLRPIIRSYGR